MYGCKLTRPSGVGAACRGDCSGDVMVGELDEGVIKRVKDMNYSYEMECGRVSTAGGDGGELFITYIEDFVGNGDKFIAELEGLVWRSVDSFANNEGGWCGWLLQISLSIPGKPW